MKNIKYLLVLGLVFLLNIGLVNANDLSDIKMNITLDENGNAHIEEVWDMKTTTDTEVYKVMNGLGNMEITNFKVTLNDKEFTYQNIWDIDGSFNDKKYKNGINRTNDGIELCWGISEYGNKKYTISYDVSNFVFNTNDAQAIYFKLFSDIKIGPDTFSAIIQGPNPYSDSLDVWGYGYKGYAYVFDGKIMMSNEENTNLSSSDYVVLLVKFPIGTFETLESNTYSDFTTFDDILNKSKEGSFGYDYSEKTSIWDTIRGVISTLFPILVVIICFIFARNNKNYKFGVAGSGIKMKEINNFRDIPCDKNIFKAFFIAQAYKLNNKNTDFLGTVFLKWLFEKKIELKKIEVKKIIGSKEEQAIILNPNTTFDNDIEKKMYDILVSASKDNILESKELQKWSSTNYGKLFKWFTEAEDYGRDLYVSSGLVYKEKLTDLKWSIKDELKPTAVSLAGLKKFLLEFSRIKEKTAIEVMLWKDYLMFAQIFGIADKVAEQFKNLYPEILNTDLDNNINVSDIILINHLSSMTVASATSARSAAQNYSGGGGGFSMGGGGGGSFGGGGGGTR